MAEEKDVRLSMEFTKNLLIAALLTIFIVAVCLAVILPKKVKTASVSTVDGSKYQAVFLTNGQVYFGKLTDNGGDYIKLTDIFYLQQQDQSKVQQKSSSTDQSNLTLIKLGKELHAPADEMNISRQQVLFWENIQDSGKVKQAIDDYKKNNK